MIEPTERARRISRRKFLEVGAAGIALLGVSGCGASQKSAQDATVVVEHDAGSTRIGAPARRVVAISDEVADLLVALEIEPAGLASSRIQGRVGEPIGDSYYAKIGDPVYLGAAEAPSFERIAALGPDLIAMDPYGAEDLHERMSEIAPTLSYVARAPGWWRGPLVDVGRATGRVDRARRFVADYDALVSELRRRVEPVVRKAPRLAVLYAPDASTTFVFDERGAPADPHAKLGFKLAVPKGTTIPEEGFAQVSPEVVGGMESDTVVVLRPTRDETPERLPLDGILEAIGGPDGGPLVLRQVIDPTRPSSSPVADRQAIEQAAELVLDAGEKQG